MNIHFSLRQQGKTDPVVILQVFDSRFAGRKFMYSTGVNIAPDNWRVDPLQKKRNKKTTIGRPKSLAAWRELSDHLDKLESTTKDWLKARYNNKTLLRGDLKKQLDNLKKDERKEQEEQLQKENDFFKTWQKIIDTTKNKAGEKISPSTKLSKQRTLDLVSEYCVDRKLKFTFESIDMAFYHDFDTYMQATLNGNSRGKHFKEIKAILREAQDRDIPVNLAYLKKSFKVIRKETDSTYLNEEEIKRLLQIKLTPAQERLRDVFAMACFVGCRHSDWHQIRTTNIIKENKKELLKITQKKTGDSIHIPIHPVVRLILNKYSGEPPRVISNQKFNEALKEICKHEDLKLGKVTINGESIEKWKEISTHTARRSFATNAYLSRAMDVYQIMRCTGHKTESSFLKYLKLNGKDYAMQAADSKFFSGEGWTLLNAS